jgi:hypothetical protein
MERRTANNTTRCEARQGGWEQMAARSGKRLAQLLLLSEDGTSDRKVQVELLELDRTHCLYVGAGDAAPGTAVRLDVSDTMLLGEVVWRHVENGITSGEIHFSEALNSMSDLAHLVENLLAMQRASAEWGTTLPLERKSA